ncbi:MAG: DUF72 domain-containing protein [Thermoprotei archaeon]|nr:MAG: DUF72 domain-containing protein [Thermoprotei archaeon]RLE97201.1 MAG: DUF72 domain-containing protein [Thermoprotei archaeon]
MEVYVGTSGWMYDWNRGGSLDWYVRFSGLNAVELNASFYRFPFPSQVSSWARKGVKLRWAIKVHRSITHRRRLTPQALEVWARFRERFKPLDHLIDFYLFQLPPSFQATETNIERVKSFARAAGLGHRMAIEFRHESWFNEETVDICREISATVVSVDSPMGTWIRSSNGIVYLRMHGRSAWYAHDYSGEELEEVAEGVLSLEPSKVYVFFNNDHWMLGNAREMLRILSRR